MRAIRRTSTRKKMKKNLIRESKKKDGKDIEKEDGGKENRQMTRIWEVNEICEDANEKYE